MKTALTLLAAATLAAAAAPALAGQNDALIARLTERFNAADKDHDGKLTKAEAQAGMPRIYENFDRIDADKKGYVTLDQIKAALAAGAGR